MKQLKTKQVRKYMSEDNSELSLSKYSFANIFNVVQKGDMSYYNICKTLNIQNTDNIPSTYFKYYKIQAGDTWTNLAFKFYKNIKLWWLICKFNNITNPFSELIVGKVIKIPTENIVESIINSLNT